MRAFAISVLVLLMLSCSETTTTQVIDFSQVESASSKQIWMIKEGLDKGLTVVNTAAIKSSTHKRAYYVGAVFTGSGIEDGVAGVWLITGDKDNPGIIQSVDGGAHNFSPYPLSKNTPAGARSTDKECKTLRKYLGK